MQCSNSSVQVLCTTNEDGHGTKTARQSTRVRLVFLKLLKSSGGSEANEQPEWEALHDDFMLNKSRGSAILTATTEAPCRTATNRGGARGGGVGAGCSDGTNFRPLWVYASWYKMPHRVHIDKHELMHTSTCKFSKNAPRTNDRHLRASCIPCRCFSVSSCATTDSNTSLLTQ